MATWLLSAAPDRANCLKNDAGQEYFPYLIVICDADSGKTLGMGSSAQATLGMADLRKVFAETAAAPIVGEPRRPAELWLLATNGPMVLMRPELEKGLGGISVSCKAPSAEVKTMMATVSDMLAKTSQRKCHVCECEVKHNSNSRCSSCKAVYYCCRNCQTQDWKRGHATACSRFKADMAEHPELVGLVELPFAPELMASGLTRARWVGWLEDERYHNAGWWRRECGCADATAFGELPPPTVPWVECTNLSLNELPSRKPWVTELALSSWATYYEARRIDEDSPVALLLHFALSAYHCLQLYVEKHPREVVPEEDVADARKQLVVHYIGPEKELDALGLFAELAQLMPSYRIRLVMIGPSVPSAMHGLRQLVRRDPLPNVEPSTMLDLEITTISGMYHEVLESYSTTGLTAARWGAGGGCVPGMMANDPRLAPDLVLGLNAGLSAYDSFGPTATTLRGLLLATPSVPCYFTDYSAEAARLGQQVLVEGGGVPPERLQPVTPNPFLSPKNEKSTEAGYDLPSFSNGFLYGAV